MIVKIILFLTWNLSNSLLIPELLHLGTTQKKTKYRILYYSHIWGKCHFHFLKWKKKKPVSSNIPHLACKSYRCVFTVQFSLVAQLCPTLCDPMNHSTPGLPVHHQLPESTQTHVHWVSDATQPSHPLSSPSPPALNFSQNQGLFKWVSSLHQVAKILEFQLQHQSFQWIVRTDFL